jgi:hypothetical protein
MEDRLSVLTPTGLIRRRQTPAIEQKKITAGTKGEFLAIVCVACRRGARLVPAHGIIGLVRLPASQPNFI